MLIIFFIFGLVIGSFLNVLVYRLNIAEKFIWGRSHCPKCKKTIDWYDNIPVVSFIFLNAKCRKCKKKISWQYPLVELAAGLLFVAVGARFFLLEDQMSWIITAYYLFALSALLSIFVYDFIYLEIPGLVLWPAIFLTIGFNLYFDSVKMGNFVSVFEGSIYSGMLAAFLGFSFFFFLVIASNEKWMGMGDAYLAILLGLILGWPQILLGLFLAFFIGSVYGIFLVAFKKKSIQSQVPFAPFLVSGSIISLFFYGHLINWYWSLF